MGTSVRPKIGSNVRLHILPGRWNIWSEGPEPASWWMFPIDDEAREADVKACPDLIDTSSGAIAVKSRWIVRRY